MLDFRRFRAADFVRDRLVLARGVPLLVSLPPLFWVADATRRASFTPLGRDQGIFQYVAWAMRRGAVDYRDIRDVNGPLTHLVHLAFLRLGGGDEHTFRWLDLLVTGLTFAFVGACVPGLHSRRAPQAMDRLAWALAGWVVLSGQYLSYKYWDIAQRESFFDWFMLPSVMLQLAVQARWPRRRTMALPVSPGNGRLGPRLWAMVAVGALAVASWFGKPTYVLVTLAQTMAVAVDDELGADRVRALAAFVVGGAVAFALATGFVASTGDLAAYVRLQFVDVPSVYRFMWARPPAAILSSPWGASPAFFSALGACVLGGLIAAGELPRRAVLLALLPLCGVGSVLLQAKGFPYHFHPVTAGVSLQWLALTAWVTQTAERRGRLGGMATVVVSAGLSLRVFLSLIDSPYLRADWLAFNPSAATRNTQAYFAHFPEGDFFPFEMRQTAAYLRQHTRSDERVQTYGMDAYVLFLAERLSATPYIYAYDLDADAALVGVGRAPGDPAFERIRTARDSHEADLLARLKESPPPAFVFFDRAPLLATVDAVVDFEEHCPHAAAWMKAHYREMARFGYDRVWLREDRALEAGAPIVEGSLSDD